MRILPPGVVVALLFAVIGLAHAQPITQGELLFSDDFARFTTDTPLIGDAWGKAVTTRDGTVLDDLVRGRNGTLLIAYSSGKVNTAGVFLEDMQAVDGVIELTVGPSVMGERPHTAIVTYRAPTGEAAGNGASPDAYHVWLVSDWSGSRDLVLDYGGQRLAAADIADEHDPNASYRLRIAFAGDHHIISVDGQTLIDFWDWHGGRVREGYVGFGGHYSSGTFDDFALYEANAAPDGPVFDTSRGQIPPAVYQGRPFIPIGTFDRPRAEDTREWLEVGGNCVIVPAFDEKLPGEERLAQVQEVADWAAQHDVAVSYYPRIDFYSYDGEQAIPTRAEEIPAKIELINEMLTVTAPHPNTLGYWTLDEPENALYKAYGQWEQRKDVGLAQWIAEGMRWHYDAFKAGDPERYVMPTIAWWTTYEGTAPIYDINVPNTYAGGDKLFQVVYDCAMAVSAIRATDTHSYIFMPPCYDTVGWPLHSIPEMRYSYIAPFTQGAMGILAWRLGRATLEYRRAVIYPVMRELNRLMPWLYGEWHDELVTSDHDTTTAEYLQELPVRVRLVPDEEDGEMARVEGHVLCDVSHCLRRAADNTWMLLAVSNRREPVEVTFTLDITGLPEKALDLIAWREIDIEAGQIVEQMEPFAVRAWRIVPD
ncbi:MAG: hypothetical protein GX358_02125 [candidate division WS1 bacterium]|nr:hypothetical protein [candidate division WS1 bacterium]